MGYKAKLNSGKTTFSEGFSVSWANATQSELEKVYELGYTKFVSKEKQDGEKATKKSKKSKVKAELPKEQGE